MVVDLTSSPIKKDIDQGSDNDLKKEDEDLENNGSDCSLLETPDWLQGAKKC